MDRNTSNGGVRRFGFMAALMLSSLSLKADPIEAGGNPFAWTVSIPILLAILIEAICIRLILRCWRKPRWFILWLLAMHLLTYPLFLGFLWLSYGSHPAMGVALGEGLIVWIEGGLIYLMCRFMSLRRADLPVPSVSRSLFASLIGNICSAAAFPLLMMLYGKIASSLMSNME